MQGYENSFKRQIVVMNPMTELFLNPVSIVLDTLNETV